MPPSGAGADAAEQAIYDDSRLAPVLIPCSLAVRRKQLPRGGVQFLPHLEEIGMAGERRRESKWWVQLHEYVSREKEESFKKKNDKKIPRWGWYVVFCGLMEGWWLGLGGGGGEKKLLLSLIFMFCVFLCMGKHQGRCLH